MIMYMYLYILCYFDWMSFKIAYNLVSVLGIKVTLDENIYHVGEIMGDQQQRIEF